MENALNEFQPQLPPNDRGRALQRRKGDVPVLGVQQSPHLTATGPHALGEARENRRMSKETYRLKLEASAMRKAWDMAVILAMVPDVPPLPGDKIGVA